MPEKPDVQLSDYEKCGSNGCRHRMKMSHRFISRIRAIKVNNTRDYGERREN